MYIDPSCTIAAEYTCSKALAITSHGSTILQPSPFSGGGQKHPSLHGNFWFWVAGAEGSQDDSECQNGSSANSQHIATYCNQMDHIDGKPMQFFEKRVPMGTPKTIESSLYIPMFPYQNGNSCCRHMTFIHFQPHPNQLNPYSCW